VHEIIRRMINRQVVDLLRTSESCLQAAAPASVEAVRAHGEPLIRFSEKMQEEHQALKRFLRSNLYRHYRVHRMSVKAQRMVRDLFGMLYEDPRLLPPEHQHKVAEMERELGDTGRARAVADYIAGMTDRYAILEHQKLFRPSELT
jgi:dGTPase